MYTFKNLLNDLQSLNEDQLNSQVTVWPDSAESPWPVEEINYSCEDHIEYGDFEQEDVPYFRIPM